MSYANLLQKTSTCVSTHFSATLQKNGVLIGTGVNGHIYGEKIRECNLGGCDRCLDRKYGKIGMGERLDECLCAHAEQEALWSAHELHQRWFYDDPNIDSDFQLTYRKGGKLIDPRGATMYTQMIPCKACAKACIQCLVSRVVVESDDYPDSGKSLLLDAGITVDVLQDMGMGYVVSC